MKYIDVFVANLPTRTSWTALRCQSSHLDGQKGLRGLVGSANRRFSLKGVKCRFPRTVDIHEFSSNTPAIHLSVYPRIQVVYWSNMVKSYKIHVIFWFVRLNPIIPGTIPWNQLQNPAISPYPGRSSPFASEMPPPQPHCGSGPGCSAPTPAGISKLKPVNQTNKLVIISIRAQKNIYIYIQIIYMN